MGRERNGGGILGYVVLAALGVVMAGMAGLATRTTVGDAEYEAALLAAADLLTGLDDLAGRLEAHQRTYLPIALPDPDHIMVQSGGHLSLFDLAAFPDTFIDGLSGVMEDGLRTFPVWVYEDGDSRGREIIVENLDGKVIARIPRPRDYSPDWFARELHPDLDTLDRETRDWALAFYDPARVVMAATLLVGENDYLAYRYSLDAAAALYAERMAESGGQSMLLMAGGVERFQFAAPLVTNGATELTLVWPEYGLATNVIDIFVCTDLVAHDWSIALTTNVNPAEGLLVWTDTATNVPRFYDAWTHHDSDGDGIPDGREVRLHGTDPFNPDTSGDGISDGWLVAHGFDPLDPTVGGLDSDGDGLTNLQEYHYGTDPHNPDTDGDGLTDYQEVYWTEVIAKTWGGGNPHGRLDVPTSLTNAVAISAGDDFSLALRPDGTVAAWGFDDDGQVTDAASVSNAVAVSAGHRHALALLEDGTVIGWGWDGYGQVSGAAGISNVTAISAGYYHSLALLADGTVAAWGDDQWDQSAGAALVTDAVAIAAGAVHSFALRSDGTIAAWGSTLPDGPDMVGGAAGVSNVTALASSWNAAMALHADGTVTGWGWVPAVTTNIWAAVAVSAGNFGCLALRSDGRVLEADGSVVDGLSMISAIAAGDGHYLALRGPLNPLSPDTDRDGLLDGYDLTVNDADPRYLMFADAGIVFTDDGALRTFKGELTAGTDPFNWTTAGHGMPDGWLVKHGLNPFNADVAEQDPDGDGLSNYLEMIYGTDPNLADTDGDGLSDSAEIMAGSDPLDPESTIHPHGAANVEISLDFAEMPIDNSLSGDGRGTLKIGTLPIPVSWDHPVSNFELYLPRGVKHPLILEGSHDYFGRPLQGTIGRVAPIEDSLVIHDPVGFFGVPHHAQYGTGFVTLPVMSIFPGNIAMQWPFSTNVQAVLHPAGLVGIYSYTADDLTVTPSQSDHGEAAVSADFPSWDETWARSLKVTFVPDYNVHTTDGEITAAINVMQTAPDEDDLDDHFYIRLHIDSLNARDYLPPTRSPEEYAMRNVDGHPGKALFINELDTDKDGIPDFMDGYDITVHGQSQMADNASAKFVPLVIQIPTNEVFQAQDAAIVISDDGVGGVFSNPANIDVYGSGSVNDPYYYSITDGGLIRLWTRNGNQARFKDSVAESSDGHWVEPGVPIPVAHLNPDSQGLITLYIEAVGGSWEIGDVRIKAQLIPGENAPEDYARMNDTVRATVFHVETIRPQAEDFEQGHEGKIMISTRHCTTNTPLRVYTTGITTTANTPAQHHDSNGNHDRGVMATAYVVPIPPENYPPVTVYFEVIDPMTDRPTTARSSPPIPPTISPTTTLNHRGECGGMNRAIRLVITRTKPMLLRCVRMRLHGC